MRVKVGDIIGIRHYSGVGVTEGNYYLITKTRNHFRYVAIFLGDGTTTELDKSYVDNYGVKVA